MGDAAASRVGSSSSIEGDDGLEARDGDSERVRREGTPSKWAEKLREVRASTKAKAELDLDRTNSFALASTSSSIATAERAGPGVRSECELRNAQDGQPGKAGAARVKRIASSRFAFLSPDFKLPEQSSTGGFVWPALQTTAAAETQLPVAVDTEAQPQSTSPSSSQSTSAQPPARIVYPEPSIEPFANTMPGKEMTAKRMDNFEKGAPCAFPRNAGSGFSIRLQPQSMAETTRSNEEMPKMARMEPAPARIESRPASPSLSIKSRSSVASKEVEEQERPKSAKRKHDEVDHVHQSVLHASMSRAVGRSCSSSSVPAVPSPVSTRFESRASLPTSASSLEAPAEKRQRTETSEQRAELRSGNYRLPFRLPRPHNVQSFSDSELRFEGDLAGVPVPYVLAKLRAHGPEYLYAISRSSVALPHASTSSLPSFVSVQCLAETTPPDYALAITSDETPSALILPVHGLVMATTCKAFSLLTRQPPIQPKDDANVCMADWQWSGTTDTSTLNLPVVHIHLPSANAFAVLVPFLYTSSPTALLSALLPLRHQSGFADLGTTPAASVDALLSDTPNVLAGRLSVLDQKILMDSVNLVHTVWQTAVALGAARDALWKTLDVTWSVLVGAIALKEGRALA